MTSRVQTQRFATTQQRPGSRPVGEFYVNFPDLAFGVVDPGHTARDLLAVRVHSATATYAAGDLAQAPGGGGLYQAKAIIPPHAFNAAEWDAFGTNAQNDTRYLRLSGGALTGPVTTTSTITLAADPTAPLQVATKQYTDNRLALYLPLTGGNLSGAMGVGGTGIAYLGVDPGAHHYAFYWDGAMHSYVDGTHVGVLAFQSWVNTNYLPLTGGDLSGNLGVLNGVQLNQSGAFFNSNSAVTNLAFDGGLWRLSYTRTSGNLAYLRGSDSATLFQVDPGGTGYFAAGLNVAGNVFAGTLTGSYVHSTNDMRADHLVASDGDVTASGDVVATNNVRAGAVVSALGGSMWMGAGGSGRIMQMANDWYWQWSGGSGDMTWTRPSGAAFFAMRTSDGVCMDFGGPCAGIGAYVNFSDARAKTDIKPAPYGLTEVLQLNPVSFSRVDQERRETGFVAQEVREIMPDAVRPLGVLLPDGTGGLDTDAPTLGMSIDPIVVALVNAVKTLDWRLSNMENR